jgi:hypothetical protein
MRRPPYAKQLQALKDNPGHWRTLRRSSTVHVLAGSNAWPMSHQYIEAGWGFCLLPPASNPEDYSWSVCAGFDPVLICVCGTMPAAVLDRLGRCLVRDGVKRALTIGDVGLFRFVATRHEGAAP